MSTMDWRHNVNGRIIPSDSYSDQPYIVKTDDGGWLCCLTTGPGHEGDKGQHIATMRSTNQGKNWSEPVCVEPGGDLENSFATLLKVPSGRIYVFYAYNSENIREVKNYDGSENIKRVDSLGDYVFRYSDDHGRSWSDRRYVIPVRLFDCDRNNIYGGQIRFFWAVGKPYLLNGASYSTISKVGELGIGFYQQSEGAILKCGNIATETDPEKLEWETLPDGDVGLHTPPGGGQVAEEQSVIPMSDGSLYVVYRSIDGYPVESYSRNGGHTWTEPQYKCFADGRRMKNPRAANFVWKCSNGKYLYWFENHGGHFISDCSGYDVEKFIPPGCNPYEDRNPAWLCGGIEVDSPAGRIIKWSEPEIVLYDDDPFIRMSYPDLVEDNGHYYITETQKDIARVHEIPADFFEKIWRSLDGETKPEIDDSEILLDVVPDSGSVKVPFLPELCVRDHSKLDCRSKNPRNGFTVELEIDIMSGRTKLFDGRSEDGRGIVLNITADGQLELIMNDGWTEHHFTTETCLDNLGRHKIAVNVDGGPRIVSFIVDGRFLDGGEELQYGWFRFSPYFRHVNWSENWQLSATVKRLRIYNRYLMTVEAVGGS